ncbi:uncharacterized protein CTRU02_207122 [Colletotrichum truncatum]|uniref:Uncharacterized protein n=1 Tax=Colletotrichum truncatum TaxID=5467 RepID=A0ACC3YZX1_COLTU|nr:uncharacterized protein CTRU02_01250 [Colletotrichum truncatum]KAF6800845.1 hypothetical protein CTRU02_01250 [Colletotrichum truncatum]
MRSAPQSQGPLTLIQPHPSWPHCGVRRPGL